jgi:hypothetical protein
MAASITKEHYIRRFHTLKGDSPMLEAVYEVTLDASYLTGGEDMDFTDGGEFATVAFVKVESTTFTGYVPQYDLATVSILLFEAGADAAALDEVASTTDVSAQIVLCTVVGTPA